MADLSLGRCCGWRNGLAGEPVISSLGLCAQLRAPVTVDSARPLAAAGNAPLITLGGVTTRPVNGLSPCHLAFAWRHDDTRPLVLDYARASRRPLLNH